MQLYRLILVSIKVISLFFIAAFKHSWDKKYSIDRKLPVMSHSARASVLWTRWRGLLCNRALILGFKEFTDTALSRELTFLHELETDIPDSCYCCYNSGSWCGYVTIFSPLYRIIKCLKSKLCWWKGHESILAQQANQDIHGAYSFSSRSSTWK